MPTKTLLSRLQRSWWFAWAVAIVLALAQAKDAVDGFEKLLILTTIKPDALALAQTAEKGEFSRSLTEAAWKRLFWARIFRTRVEMGAPESEINDAWRSYISASEVWSTRIMVFIVTTEKFYGSEKSNALELNVQSALGSMGKSLAAIRYAKSPDPALLKQAEKSTDEANAVLYQFVRGFHEKKA
jgi:hypothetical protein